MSFRESHLEGPSGKTKKKSGVAREGSDGCGFGSVVGCLFEGGSIGDEI